MTGGGWLFRLREASCWAFAHGRIRQRVGRTQRVIAAVEDGMGWLRTHKSEWLVHFTLLQNRR